MFVGKEEEKIRRQLGRDDIFLIKKMYIHAKKNAWQAIYQNTNGGRLWVGVVGSFHVFCLLSCVL